MQKILNTITDLNSKICYYTVKLTMTNLSMPLNEQNADDPFFIYLILLLFTLLTRTKNYSNSFTDGPNTYRI